MLKKENNNKIEIVNHTTERSDNSQTASNLSKFKNITNLDSIKKEKIKKEKVKQELIKNYIKKTEIKNKNYDQEKTNALDTESETKKVLSNNNFINSTQATRSHVKKNEITLTKDSTWQMADGLKNKWFTSKFF